MEPGLLHMIDVATCKSCPRVRNNQHEPPNCRPRPGCPCFRNGRIGHCDLCDCALRGPETRGSAWWWPARRRRRRSRTSPVASTRTSARTSTCAPPEPKREPGRFMGWRFCDARKESLIAAPHGATTCCRHAAATARDQQPVAWRIGWKPSFAAVARPGNRTSRHHAAARHTDRPRPAVAAIQPQSRD